MKGKFVFDAAENDIINIPENTIIRDTGVKSENVKVKVKKAIKSNKNPNRRIKKRKIFSFIAAAAAIAVIGTVTAAAAGGFNGSLGEFFAGEPAQGVFPGKDVVLESSNLDIDFMGIAGDNDQVYAMMKLTKKDGTAFADINDDTFIDNYDPENSGIVMIEKTLWNNIFEPAHTEIGAVSYSFTDDKTLCALITCTDDNKKLIGSRLNVSDNMAAAYTPVKTIYTPKNGDGYSTLSTESGSGMWNIDETVVYDLEKKYEGKLKDDQVIRLSEDRQSVIIAQKTDIYLDYEVDVTLNYKPTLRSITSSKGKKYSINNSEWEIDFITAGSFTMNVSAHTWDPPQNDEFDTENMDNRDEEKTQEYYAYRDSFIPRNFTITLKDGKTYTAAQREIGLVSSCSIGDGFGEVSVTLSYYDENGSLSALDPDDISAITFENQLIS